MSHTRWELHCPSSLHLETEQDGVSGSQRLSAPKRRTGGHRWEEGESERLRRTDGPNTETPVGKRVEEREALPIVGRTCLSSRKRCSALTYLKPPSFTDGSLS